MLSHVFVIECSLHMYPLRLPCSNGVDYGKLENPLALSPFKMVIHNRPRLTVDWALLTLVPPWHFGPHGVQKSQPF